MPAPPKHRLNRKTKVQALKRGSRFDELVDPKLTGNDRRKALQKLYVLASRGELEKPEEPDAEAQVATGRVMQSAVAVALPCSDPRYLHSPAALGPPSVTGGHRRSSHDEASVGSGDDTAEYLPSEEEGGDDPSESQLEGDDMKREVSVQTELCIPMTVQIFGFSGLQGAGAMASQ